MARMMPGYCPADAPPGERAVYEALASHPDTDDWLVLHSLAIAEHVRQVEGEADFVVIVPGAGLLVVEVKSHRSLEILDDGQWRLGRNAPTARTPFQQAQEAMYSLRSYVNRRDRDLRSVPFSYAVWFTHLRVGSTVPPTPEWHPWQLLDADHLRANPAAAILKTLASARDHLQNKVQRFGSSAWGPTKTEADALALVLRPRFEAYVSPSDRRQRRSTELTSFIEEQYQALDAMTDNRAVLFTGPAGSGKTLLAIESVQRELAQGRSGRLLCFNALLGHRLRADLAGVERVSVGTLHQELLKIVGTKPPPEADSSYWDSQLPERALEVLLLDEAQKHAADFLIVDEFQDIAREAFLDILEFLVKGGLDSGRIIFFGDFERQAIFGPSDGRQLLEGRCTWLTYSRLTTNCRNLPRIGYSVNVVSKLKPGYERFRRHDDGVDPSFVTYERGEEQSRRLVEAIQQLREDGFGLNEIAVLSVLRAGSTAETTSDPWLLQILESATGLPPRPGRVQHSTIHAFKGLESAAVVVTDLDRRQTPNFEALLYVGMTRATDRLVALIQSETLRAAFGGTA